MQYYFSEVDSNNYTYSIDNVIVEYIIKGHIDITNIIDDLVKKYDLSNEYWNRLNCPYCSKYQYYNNHYHVCNGIYIMSGKYSTKSDLTNTYDIYPIIKLEINPNKHGNKPIFNDLLKFLKENSGDCTLKRYDFCIDIPLKKECIEVIGSRKEKGLYKGTRYYGQRNKDGYLKIYDKAKEMNIETDLTRIEYTLVYDKGKNAKKGINLQDIYISCDDLKELEVNKTDKALIRFYNLCKSNNIDCENILNDLDKRTKKRIIENINGYTYNELKIDIEKHDILLNKIKDLFGVIDQKHIYTDKDGFLVCPGGFSDLPFN